MEVHHHGHSHGKKTWRSYFWEFMMLFLAVFCGFMAEYQLEHKIEKEREKQYIISMIEDLQKDTANLRISISMLTLQDPHFDSVITHFRQLTTGYSQSMHNSLKTIIGYRDFFPADKTMQQLKNSGAMRLIRNKASADSIMTYDSRLKRFQKGIDVLDGEFTKMYDLYLTIIDNAELEHDKTTMSITDMERGTKNYLLVTDKAVLGRYYNNIKAYRQLRQIAVGRMTELKQSATDLIMLLKKEYHLD